MKGSLRIGTVAGTGVFLHWSFLLLFGWLFISQVSENGFMAALQTLLFIGTVFLCVTLHEIGHATMARRFGIRTQDITLLPIGGVARLCRIPEEPEKELLIALAGPVVNVVIAASLYAGMLISGLNVSPIEGSLAEASFLVSIFWFNVVVVAFNMLPAFPMDGGRVFRALLARRRSYVEATQSAARIGQAIAMAFIFIGLMSNWMLAIVGVFVFLGATAEAKSVEVRALTSGATAADAMLTDYVTFEGHHRLGDVARELLAGSQTTFPVRLSNGQTGLLIRPMLLSALKSHGPAATLDEVIEKAAPSIPAGMSLDESMEKLAEVRGPVLVVNSLSQPVGLLTLDNFQEWVQVETVLQSRSASSKNPPHTPKDHCPALDELPIEKFVEDNRFFHQPT